MIFNAPIFLALASKYKKKLDLGKVYVYWRYNSLQFFSKFFKEIYKGLFLSNFKKISRPTPFRKRTGDKTRPLKSKKTGDLTETTGDSGALSGMETNSDTKENQVKNPYFKIQFIYPLPPLSFKRPSIKKKRKIEACYPHL